MAPLTDVSRGDERKRKASLRRALRSTYVRATSIATIPKLSQSARTLQFIRAHRDAELTGFVATRISTTRLYKADGSVDQEVLANVDSFVIGSDQVWRGRFGRVPTYLLDFLPDDDRRMKVAYAASFGTDDLSEYSAELLTETRRLAQRLNHVSVRERSGVELCEKAWGVEALHVADPTLLLPPDTYRKLAAESVPTAQDNQFATYILDKSRGVLSQVEIVSRALGVDAVSLLPADPTSIIEYRRHPKQYARPSVEQWLHAIGSARFVLTDSFHGTVFAILHNVPFITIVNRSRGAARFESLLGELGLVSRMIEPGEQIDQTLLAGRIDWDSVNSALCVMRENSMTYLARALRSGSPGAVESS